MGQPNGVLKSPELEGRANGVELALAPWNVRILYDVSQVNGCRHHWWRRCRTVTGVRLPSGWRLRAFLGPRNARGVLVNES